MKHQWRIIVGFVLVLIVVLFAVSNNTVVDVSFLVVEMKAPLILIILGSAIVGALIVVLTSVSTIWSQKRTIKKMQDNLDGYQEDYDNKVANLEEKYHDRYTELQEDYEAKLTEKQEIIDQLLKDEINREEEQPYPTRMDLHH